MGVRQQAKQRVDSVHRWNQTLDCAICESPLARVTVRFDDSSEFAICRLCAALIHKVSHIVKETHG